MSPLNNLHNSWMCELWSTDHHQPEIMLTFNLSRSKLSTDYFSQDLYRTQRPLKLRPIFSSLNSDGFYDLQQKCITLTQYILSYVMILSVKVKPHNRHCYWYMCNKKSRGTNSIIYNHTDVVFYNSYLFGM